VPLRPWIGKEPVQVRPDIPNEAYEQKRYTQAIPAGTITMLGPPDGFYWVIDCVQLELQCSGNVGTRIGYYYAEDKNGRRMRYMFAARTAGQITTHVATPYGTADRLEHVTGANMYTSTGPSYFTIMQSPCKVGALLDFGLGGDTLNMHILVREYKVQ